MHITLSNLSAALPLLHLFTLPFIPPKQNQTMRFSFGLVLATAAAVAQLVAAAPIPVYHERKLSRDPRRPLGLSPLTAITLFPAFSV